MPNESGQRIEASKAYLARLGNRMIGREASDRMLERLWRVPDEYSGLKTSAAALGAIFQTLCPLGHQTREMTEGTKLEGMGIAGMYADSFARLGIGFLSLKQEAINPVIALATGQAAYNAAANVVFDAALVLNGRINPSGK